MSSSAVDPFKVDDFSMLSDEQLMEAAAAFMSDEDRHKKECAIAHYKPVSEQVWKVHQSTAKVCGISGGNRSSKTESAVAEMVMLCTGVMPERFRLDPIFRSKFRGPMRCRMVVESIKHTFWNVIQPKFQWYKWNGPTAPGGDLGHWGWIPKTSLKGGSWENAFSKEQMTITGICRDPDNPKKQLGEFTISFMSKDNDSEDFASGEFHIVIEDEPPTEAIHTENRARVRSVNGRILISMTWPDDPTIPVTWLNDEVYEPGRPGPNKDPQIDWFELDSRDNPHQSMEGLQFDIDHYSEDKFNVRVLGQSMTMSSRVHPLFTDREAWWCFDCKKETYVEEATDATCKKCRNHNVVHYCHVQDADVLGMPIIFCLDPHPRKPHMIAWIAVTPQDDYYQLAEVSVDGTPLQVMEEVVELERSLKMRVAKRIMDPNMGATSPGLRRRITWQDEFGEAGLRIDLADDSGVGVDRVNEYLAPDRDTLAPRIHVHSRCVDTIRQFKRYQWDNHKIGAERGLKEKSKQTDDDFPTLWKYLVNDNPNFRHLRLGAPVLGRKKMRQGSSSQGRRQSA